MGSNSEFVGVENNAEILQWTQIDCLPGEMVIPEPRHSIWTMCRVDVPKCIRHCLSNTCLLHELFAWVSGGVGAAASRRWIVTYRFSVMPFVSLTD